MILMIACHAGIMLGVTVALTLLLRMSSEEFITIWLSFTAAVALTNWLLTVPDAPSSVLDLFERIEQ